MTPELAQQVRHPEYNDQIGTVIETMSWDMLESDAHPYNWDQNMLSYPTV